MNLSDRLGDAAVERAARSRVRFQPLDEPVATRSADRPPPTGDVARIQDGPAPPTAQAAIDLSDGGDRIEIVLPSPGRPRPPGPPQAEWVRSGYRRSELILVSPDLTDATAGSTPRPRS